MIGSPVEEIKARVDLVDFIREYVPLKKMGGNWKGLCPFHGEKTPSFMVSSDKGIWKCFGCGAGGDLFAFLMKREGMEFPEALRALAQRAGVELRAHDPKIQNQRSRLLDLLFAAADFFHSQLTHSPAAEAAREYLSSERKLSRQTIDSFRVGFAPHSWNDLSRYILDQGFSESELLLSGLVVASERRGSDQRALPFYDRFRGRITFPITDVHGNVIGFGARIFVKESEEPKYLNTPSTMLYDKSSALFGLGAGKRAVQEAKQAILLEGYMDVLASHQAGVHHVVAPCGTAFTPEQARLLLRYAPDLLFCFDSDAAGETAEERAADVGWDAGARLFSLSPLPHGVKDVDELVRSDPALWREHARVPKPFFVQYEQRLARACSPADVSAKQDAVHRLLDRLSHCASAVEQEHWRSYIAERWAVSNGALSELLARKRKSPARSAPAAPSQTPAMAQDVRARVAERLVALVLTHPMRVRPVLVRLNPTWLPESFQQAFADAMTGRDPSSRMLLLGESLYQELDDDAVSVEAEELLGRARQLFLRAELERLSRELREREAVGNSASSSELFEQFHRVTEELALL